VAIFQSDQLCVPLITKHRKTGPHIPIVAVAQKETAVAVQG
jgi:hypothetical protein